MYCLCSVRMYLHTYIQQKVFDAVHAKRLRKSYCTPLSRFTVTVIPYSLKVLVVKTKKEKTTSDGESLSQVR